MQLTTPLLRAVLKISSGAVALTLATACSISGRDGGSAAPVAASDTQPDIPIVAVSNQLRFESGVPADQVAAVKESIASLYVLPLDMRSSDVSEMATKMDNSDVTPAGMQTWMETRVGYIVHQGYDFDSNANPSSSPFDYPSPKIFPDALKGLLPNTMSSRSPVSDSSSAQVVMLNMGAAIYAEGKAAGKLVDLTLPGLGTVAMTSPRVGVLEVGPGLFPDLGTTKVQNVLLDVYRVGTLFHEARHSDGHARTLGFMHATCPDGDYAGKAACDASTNGPYTVGSMVHKNLMNSCTNCTELTKQALESIYLDLSDRVLDPYTTTGLSPDAPAGAAWDDTPEGHR